MSYIGHAPASLDRSLSHAGPAHPTPAQLQVKQHDIEGQLQTETETDDSPTPTEDVGTLARYLSTHSHSPGAGTADMFNYEKGSELDPFGDRFDVKLWVRKFASLEDWGQPRASGISFKDMSVFGYGTDADYQKTIANIPLSLMSSVRDLVDSGRKRRVTILNGVDGVLEAGEMLVVLGPPGSGCTTYLKTIAGEMNGIYLDEQSEINYRGITKKQMESQFRGEASYTAEVDVHFPKLTVGQTLAFAAEARSPANPPAGLTQREYAKHLRDVIMAIFGISHTKNTIVGDHFIRGVSGGERKRVTIAEAALSGAPLQCWDNSTRGLDSANAVQFCKTLRTSAEYFKTTSVVAIYQAPQSAYDQFDKVSVLYEGEQIYFGRATEAKDFFVNMGFECPPQQTVPDFLTSLTSPSERKARPGFEDRVPRTPQEFTKAWKSSPEYVQLQKQINEFGEKYPFKGKQYEEFVESRRWEKSKHSSTKSPYTLSYWGQIALCLKRGFWRLKADPTLTLTQLFGNFIMSLVIGSVFVNQPETTASFRPRGAALFFAILINAFGAALEILTLYAQRSIVEKHTGYAFYRPSGEAIASMLTDLPYKLINAITSNIPLYFMIHLRREAGPFFFYLLISFVCTLAMSSFFRLIAATSRNLVQALTPTAVIMLGLVMYAGFAIPVSYMRGWAAWMRYLNPVYYALESLLINEFQGRTFACTEVVPSGPGYEGASGSEQSCAALGSEPGSLQVGGTAYIQTMYEADLGNKWRNFGILLAFAIGLGALYLIASDLISAEKSKGEVLVYQRGRLPAELIGAGSKDIESGPNEKTSKASGSGSKEEVQIQKQTSIVSWKDVTYDIKIKGEERRILDHIDGWVKPGTLTALMGVSGAGKTTLLDVLATRVTMGVVGGRVQVDGRPRDESFQRKTGYVQQQDVHLETSTIREALEFSALLRQPRHASKEDKLAYVDEVLKLLEMDTYADAVIGAAGEGLNVEQRKRLTIGVELVAKPALLLFLDEPTSGLDSQTSWNILQLLRKLAAHGQAILCTIHQPSAILFEQFDRLLFLAKGGKTVYYGQVGEQSHILIDYFEKNGAQAYKQGENPAEWMLEVIGAAPGSKTEIDWHQRWLDSPQRGEVRDELDRIEKECLANKSSDNDNDKHDASAYSEFAAPFGDQLMVTLKRSWWQLWRSPSYIYSKVGLCALSGLYIGFSFFDADRSQQGIQSQLFSVFMLFLLFGQLLEQMFPIFINARAIYEVRERPSKIYSWKVFMLSNILVELPWALVSAVFLFLPWYYPAGFYKNAQVTDTVHERGALMFLFVLLYLLFTSSFGYLCVAAIETAETAGNIANLLFIMCLIFCGVLATPDQFPGFWIFMYRLSPFTYVVGGMIPTGVALTEIECSQQELVTFAPPAGSTCGEYMEGFMSVAGGYLTDPASTSECNFCSASTTDQLLAQFGISYETRWRDFGLLWAYVVFNIAAAVGLYWLIRVPKKKKEKTE